MNSIKLFATQPFITALKALFAELQIPVNYIDELPATPASILGEMFKPDNEAHRMIGDVYLFGMVNDGIFQGNSTFSSVDEVKKLDKDYDGLLIFGVTLQPRNHHQLPIRSQLAGITRSFNRAFPYTPVTIIFRYGNHISLANTERTRYKQQWREGEKIGKVSLLKDVDCQQTHTGHLRILSGLVKPSGVKTFKELNEHWLQVLDVSILNKKFYLEIFNWYLWALREANFPQIRPQDEIIDDKIHQSESLIRLLTRLLFVWFMKEKGLISPEIFSADFLKNILKDFSGVNGEKTIYYKAILQNLFFATLNQSVEQRKVLGKGFNPSEYGDPLVYRFDELFTEPEKLPEYFKDIPFLNGGLFECLDQKKDNENDVEIRLDGFSTKKSKQVHLPDKYFFGEYAGVDLSTEYDDTKKRSITVNGIIDILSHYKFTIEESTPVEEEIALDPELLGKVFENLLASYNPETQTTARKQTGSFYTPREIVNYMVDESLIQYLKSALTIPGQGDQHGALAIPGQGDQHGALTIPGQGDQHGALAIPSQGDQHGALAIPSQGDQHGALAIPGQREEDQTPTEDGQGTFSPTKDGRGTLWEFFNPNNEIQIHTGNLPHWQQGSVWYFISFRLADSIPAKVAEQIKADREMWLKTNKKDVQGGYSKEQLKEYYRLFSEKTEKLLDNGIGSCILKKPGLAQIVADALHYFNNQRYVLDEWVIMPNHVHLLVKPIGDHKLQDILHSWKSFTANEINKRTGNKGQLWMHESYDHIVRNEKALDAIRHYIRQNPVKAHLKEGSYLSKVSGSIPASGYEDIPAFGTLAGSRDASDTLEERLRQLFSFEESTESNPFDPDETKALIMAIDDCKILDPACGSGAFPMGALQKMTHILHKLDPENKIWFDMVISNLPAYMQAEARKKLEKENWNYVRKLGIIQQCLYGVDIQPIAIQISKLRFFISLLVDQQPKPGEPNMGYEPLPNLDFKLVAANTLIGAPENDATKVYAKGAPERFETLSNEYFSAVSERKTEIKEELKKTIRRIVEANQRVIGQWMEKIRKEYNSASTAKRKQNQQKLDEFQQDLDRWSTFTNLYKNESVAFFETKYFFPQVKEGFDVVIGNPPYIAFQRMDSKAKDALQKQRFKTFENTGDIYALFYEKGIDLLKENGLLVYITSRQWMQASYGKSLRKYLSTEVNPIQLIDFGQVRIFEGATVFVNTLLLSKKESNKSMYACLIPQDYNLDSGSLCSYFLKNKLKIADLGERTWAVSNENAINSKIEKVGFLLREWENIGFFRGITSGLNDVFYVDENTRKQFINHDQSSDFILKPLLRGKDIKRYHYDYKDWYIINTHNGLRENGLPRIDVVNDYPVIYEYLKQWQPELEKRLDQGDHWTNLRNCAFLLEFEKPKIVWIEISDRANYAYDDKGMYLTNSAYFLTSKSEDVSLKYLLAILNSKVSDFYFSQKTARIAGGRMRYTKQYVEQVPIPKIEMNQQMPFITLVDQILTTRQSNPHADTTALENRIDELVFKLYGLTYEEVKVIAPDFWLGEGSMRRFNYNKMKHHNEHPC